MTTAAPVHRRPAARAALGWAVLCFLALQLALGAGLDRWQPDLFDGEYSAKLARLRARLAEHPGDPLVLVLGSSRPLVGLRPAGLQLRPGSDGRRPVVFNAALTGSGPILELMCLRRLLAEKVHPAWVVVECWPPSWHEQDGFAEDARIEADRLSWRDLRLLRHYTEHPFRFYAEWLGERLLTGFHWRARLLQRCAGGWLPAPPQNYDLCDGDGWLGWPRPPTAAERQAWLVRDRLAYQEMLHDLRPAATCDLALHELLALCRRQHIRVALVFMPEASVLRDYYAPATLARVDRYLRQLSQENGVPLIDARDWVADADFADTHHLLRSGARIFSARLGREALGPLLGGQDALQERRAAGLAPAVWAEDCRGKPGGSPN
jgi:hypothetical protein